MQRQHSHTSHHEELDKAPLMQKNMHSHTEGHPTVHRNYQPINWDAYFDELTYLTDGTSLFRAGHAGALFFCVHGAGESALSFAALAREVKHFGTLVAFDLPAHGYSKCPPVQDGLAIESLCALTITTLKTVMELFPQKNVVIVGHSLGGSIACRIVETLVNIEKMERVSGCIVIDVVEGTALQALPFMGQLIADRPLHFESLESAIKWSVTSGLLRKLESARVSIPPQLVEQNTETGKIYKWKVPLATSQKHWHGWFHGLSQIFLGIHIPKLLLTADKERLDKELTIAQMQGKFKLVSLHNVGHSLQEDDYRATAHQCYNFLRDFRIPMTLSEKAERDLVGVANFHPALPKY